MKYFYVHVNLIGLLPPQLYFDHLENDIDESSNDATYDELAT